MTSLSTHKAQVEMQGPTKSEIQGKETDKKKDTKIVLVSQVV